MAIGVLGKTDCSRLANTLQSRGDIDSVAHQIAVGLLDDVAEVNADTELDAAFGRQARIAFDHAVLQFNRATHGVDHAAELDKNPVPGALDDAAMVHGDGRIDQVAAQRPEPRERTILVRAREPAVADDVCDQNGRDLSGLAHCAPPFRRGAG